MQTNREEYTFAWPNPGANGFREAHFAILVVGLLAIIALLAFGVLSLYAAGWAVAGWGAYWLLAGYLIDVPFAIKRLVLTQDCLMMRCLFWRKVWPWTQLTVVKLQPQPRTIKRRVLNHLLFNSASLDRPAVSIVFHAERPDNKSSLQVFLCDPEGFVREARQHLTVGSGD